MMEFIAAVAASIASVAAVAKNLGEIAKGGRYMLDFADNIVALARKESDGHPQAELRQALVRIAAMPQVEFDKEAEEVIDVGLADKPPEYRKAVTEYVKLIPPGIRATSHAPRTRPAPPRPRSGRPRARGHHPVPAAASTDVPGRRFAAGSQRNGTSPSAWHRRIRRGLEGPQQDDAEHLLRVQILPRPGLAAADLRERARERQGLAKNELIDHPNVVKLIDAYLEGDTPWLQYEYVPGGDLGQLVRTWPEDLAVRASLAVENIRILADTLGHCHNELSRKVIHRDMKPANLLVGRNGTLKITDFGISDTQARQALRGSADGQRHGRELHHPSLVR